MVRKGMLLLALWTGSLTGAVGAESASEIAERLQKLKVLGSVLYLAAHPDDENTKLIAYWARGRLLETGYLSLTRGSGGQNLIGPELGPELGLIRTHELLGARQLDGGRQLFSRARDFGFSKHPKETFSVWDRREVLEDVVLALRTFRPDVVVTRFSPEPGYTHGHHTASTLLAQEAFRLSGDPTAFPEQLTRLEPWQPRRLFWNLSEWHFRQRGEPFDESLVDARERVSGASWLRGQSYPGLAAQSRSQHKSQGFGAGADWSEQVEMLHLLDGEPLPPGAPDDPFAGLELGWSRLPGGQALEAQVEALVQGLEPTEPWRSLEKLIELRETLQPERWEPSVRPLIERKRAEVEELITACSGLQLRAESPAETVEPGSAVTLKLQAVQRAPVELHLESVEWRAAGQRGEVPVATTLEADALWTSEATARLPASASPSHPHWLEAEPTRGMYRVVEPRLRLEPEAHPELAVQWRFRLGGPDGPLLIRSTPWLNRQVDPVDGELLKEVAIVAPISVELPSEPLLLVDGEDQGVEVLLRSRPGNPGAPKDATVRLLAPPGFEVSPSEQTVRLPEEGGESVSRFQVFLDRRTGERQGDLRGVLKAEAVVNQTPYHRTVRKLAYPHIGQRYLHPQAEQTVVAFSTAPRKAVRVGYLPGAGDRLPQALEQMGYPLRILDSETLSEGDLDGLDTVVLGVRAFNVHPNMEILAGRLFAFAERGGTLVVQYTTTAGLKTNRLAPLPLTLSRLRVTDEAAPVRLLAPEHPMVVTPNRLQAADFEGWVQERGLYFMSGWDPAFVPLLGMADPDEEELQGALLVAPYGDGQLIYTGLSLFRQLPAGVPGAYRLLQNLVEYGHHD